MIARAVRTAQRTGQLLDARAIVTASETLAPPALYRETTMQSSGNGKALDLKVRRVLKTNVRGGIGQSAVAPSIGNGSLTASADSVISPSDIHPPDNSSSIPNSQTGPASGGGSYTSRGGTRTKK